MADETNVVLDALLSPAPNVRGSDRKLGRRVADRADAIAYEMGIEPVQRAIIRKAAILRDVGKAGIPESILEKSGPLTAGEYEQIRSRMLPVADEEDSEPVRLAIEIAACRHERFDGTGFPDRLAGDRIPRGARILAAAEAYETMIVDTAWRPAKEPEAALAEVIQLGGSRFDPEVVAALERTVKSGKPGWRSRRTTSNRKDYWTVEKQDG